MEPEAGGSRAGTRRGVRLKGGTAPKVTTPGKDHNGEDRSLGRRAYEELRADILTGRIPGGTRLVEASLAEEMQISRTPVREALQKLALEGFVEAIPRVGYFVTQIDEYDVLDLFATRTAIEHIAAQWALQRITDEELQQLEELVLRSEQLVAEGRSEEMIDLDTEFHDVICRAARSKRLYQISQMLREHMLQLRVRMLHLPNIAQRASGGHSAILAALKAKDGEGLSRAVQTHMDETKDDVLSFLRSVRERSF
jgi:DNA-binding GntR family transcriptional regulator